MHVKAVSPPLKASSPVRAQAGLSGSRPAAPVTSYTALHSFSDVAVDAPILQRKLMVGAVDDPLEREADRIADQVMRMPASGLSVASAPLQLNRKCAACEEEEGQALQPKRAGSSAPTGGVPGIVHEVLRSPGVPLDPATRAFFELRFGQDFGRVRVHTDVQAAESARLVSAHAYTVGRNIVFAPGRFAPRTEHGRQLLAHELAHTIQQSAAGPPGGVANVVQRQDDPDVELPRPAGPQGPPQAVQQQLPPAPPPAPPPPAGPAPSDIQISDVSRSANPKNIFFDRQSAALDPSQTPKIMPLAGTTPADQAQALTLRGFVSEDENAPPASGTTLANARIAAVDSALRAAGHGGPQAHSPDTTASQGNLDYRSMRKVEVLPSAAPSATPHCAPPAPPAGGAPAGAATPPPGIVPCAPATQFTTAQTRAETLLDTAITALSATPVAAITASLLDHRFGSKPANRAAIASKVLTNLIKLKTHIHTQMKPVSAAGTGPGHRCANECDAACQTAIAYNQFTDASARMTLCQVPSRSEAFMQEANVDERAGVLIHEGLHGITLAGAPVGSGAEDFAYREQRLIKFLDPATALKNNDSYVIFVRVLNGQAVAVGRTPGSAPPDILAPGVVFAAPEKLEVDRALAWLEGWTIWAHQEVESLYSAINEILTPPGKTWANVCCADDMKEIATRFGLTLPPALPTANDKFAVAAVNDRFLQIEDTLYSVASLTIDRTIMGATSWAPGPAQALTIGPDFFGVAAGAGRGRAQLNLLIQAIVAATPDISPGARPAYVALFNRLRILRGGGSP
jgi:hypothetical protein